MTRVCVVGSVNLDIGFDVQNLPRPGETALAGSVRSTPGGKGANQAVAAARAGGKAAFLGRIGIDIFGARLRQGLQDNGVDTRLLGEVEGASGTALIISGGGNNMIVVAPGANDAVTADAIDGQAFTGIRFVLSQLETPLDGVLKAAKLARAAGATFILDPAPARTLPSELLSLVDWLTPNESEACTLLGMKSLGDPTDMARRLKALGPRGGSSNSVAKAQCC